MYDGFTGTSLHSHTPDQHFNLKSGQHVAFKTLVIVTSRTRAEDVTMLPRRLGSTSLKRRARRPLASARLVGCWTLVCSMNGRGCGGLYDIRGEVGTCGRRVGEDASWPGGFTMLKGKMLDGFVSIG